MAWTIGDVARTARVSVRTLHHYDALGLLEPSDRSEAGYRLYTMPDLEKLQQILFFKELGFCLEDIGRIMRDPSFDRCAALLEQRRLLAEKARRTDTMLASIDGALDTMKKGTHMDKEEMFEVFGDFDPADYQQKAEEHWGDTEAYQESARRYAKMTKDDLKAMKAETDQLEAALATAMAEGRSLEDAAVQELVERHRLGIENWYPCSPEMHANLGEMYVADARFTKHYDDVRPGLAIFLRDAIRVAADGAE
jgi:DNA-binding transcriptional MerR regulator